MNFKIKNAISMFTIFYPIIYLFISIISNDLARKLSLFAILLLIINILLDKNRKCILYFLSIILISIYNIMVFGINYVIHQDYYGYILILLVFINYIYKYNRITFEYLLRKSLLKWLCILFIIGILISIFIGQGLQYSSEWGTTMPLLYGPYDLPHSLSYQLLIMFMYSSIGYHKYKEKCFLVFGFVFSLLLAWTGVRSAFLVLFILYLFEFNFIKNSYLKIITIIFGFAVLLYLFLFTDFLVNNPIMQKTIQALGKSSGITNGRFDFNDYLLNVYIYKLSFIDKIFGCSIDVLRYYMLLRYSTALHAHNDILNCLIGMGAAGLFLYLKCFMEFCKNSSFIKTVIPIFILAFTNGLFMYTCITPCLYVFIIYAQQLDSNR